MADRHTSAHNPRVNEKSNHLSYRRDIDGLRALAVSSVVIFHAAPGRLPSGFIGVDIFFVISGYLISSIILNGIKSGQFTFSSFYVRRIKRIFPALITILCCSLFSGYLLFTDEELSELGRHVAAGSAFVSNFLLLSESGYFDTAAEYKTLLHLWSLSVEEQFYLIWPLLLWAAAIFRVTHAKVIVTVFVLSLCLCIYFVNWNSAIAFYSPFTRFWELSLGGTLAAFGGETNVSAGFRVSRSIISMLAGAVLFIGFLTIKRGDPFPGWTAMLPTIGAAMLIWAGPRAYVNRVVLGHSAAVWVGLISFPIYLWHWPLLAFPRILEGTEIAQWKRFVAVGVSVPLAWVTYRFIEKPLRTSNGKWVVPALVLTIVLVGITGLTSSVSGGMGWRTWAPRVENIGGIGTGEFFEYVGTHFFPCSPPDLLAESKDGSGFLRCPQSKPDSRLDIAVVGDSHAESLFPGIAEKFSASNVVWFGNGGGLPFISNDEYAKIFKYISEDKNIRFVVIAAAWTRKIKLSEMQKFHKELLSTSMFLKASGKKVILVDDVPTFSFAPMRCKFSGRLGLPNRCEEFVGPTNTVYQAELRDISKSGTLASFISVRNAFCDLVACSMAHDGRLLFRDEHHLTIAGSRRAAERFPQGLMPHEIGAAQ